MSKTKRIALLTAIFCATAAPISAAPSASLATGGNTIAGPSSVALAAEAAQTVYTDASGNSDACTTVSNTGKNTVEISVTGDGSGTDTVLAGQTMALCRNEVTEVTLTCLAVAPGTCAAQWRVDRN